MTTTRQYGGVSAESRIAARRERLLEAGLELFGTRGVSDTGVKDVCREAGLTDRYFYESFRGGTRELFTAVFDRVTDELFTGVAQAVAAVPPEPEPQLRASINAFVRALADDPRRRRVVFSEAGAAGAEAERHMRATLRRFTALVAATAQTHVGKHVTQAQVHLVALSLVGTLERAVIEWEDGELAEPIEQLVDDVVGLYLVLLNGLQ